MLTATSVRYITNFERLPYVRTLVPVCLTTFTNDSNNNWIMNGTCMFELLPKTLVSVL